MARQGARIARPDTGEEITVYQWEFVGRGTCASRDARMVLDDVALLLSEGGNGDKMIVGVGRMGEAEYDALPEFEGW